MRNLLLTGLLVVSGYAVGWAGEVEFVEDFSLTRDREAALKQLIPGTQDYYYWTCLHLLNTEQYDQVEKVLQLWVPRHGETERVWEIRTRHALLTYDRHPQKSLDYLRYRFAIHYPHRKEQLNADPDLPTALDGNIISREQFQLRALANHPDSLNGFEQSALAWLMQQSLTPTQRRQLLERLDRPDHENLVQWVANDLAHPKSKGFGSLKIHRQLLKNQLDALLKIRPQLLNQQQFIETYLVKLQPNPDVDWRHNRQEHRDFLARIRSFADRLAPVHNSLKAHILYHQLILDRSLGKYNKGLFLAYIKLPRPGNYISRTLLESDPQGRSICNLNADYNGTTLHSPIRNDESLVRSYLAHLLVDAADPKEYEPYINDIYLRHLFAEVKIVNGLGEPEEWASLLPPEPFRQLRERVDIEFNHANTVDYRAEDAVSLDLYVKHVNKLIVKVFEINTQSYYQRTGKEVDTNINLDGLVANVEQTHEFDESPLRRVKRTFDFPMLDKPGVYVIDFIGNGQSSRALIRKGRLRHLVKTTPAGQSFTILNEDNQLVTDASHLACRPRVYGWQKGNDPRSLQHGTRPSAVCHHGSHRRHGRRDLFIARLFPTRGRTIQLYRRLLCRPRTLLRGKKAQVAIRPGLSVNGTPVSLKLLEDVTLTITSTDLDGTPSSVTLSDFQLFEDRETVHNFQVPPRLANIRFHLASKIKHFVTGKKEDYATEDSFSLNAITLTDKIDDLHLLRTDGQYILELRGLTGESRASRPVQMTFKHRDFRDPTNVVLKTDPGGRIALGALLNIESMTAKGPAQTDHSWRLVGDRHSYSRAIHSRTGEPIVVPYLGSESTISHNELSLLELRGGTFTADRFDHLQLRDGLIVIEDLPAGDYDLQLKATGNRLTLRVTDGKQLGPYFVGDFRQLESKPLAPLQIESITVEETEAEEDQIVIQLQNISKFSRVHVYASRYVPEYSVFKHLSRVGGAEPYLFRYSPASSIYLTGRNIGDEYRYIIDRRYANKHRGNMLQRPSLLLNPWAVRDTHTGSQEAAGGESYGRTGDAPQSSAERAPSEEPAAQKPAPHLANLDFLALPTAVLANLIPDEQGRVEIPRSALGPHQDITVVAVDPLHTTVRSKSLPESKTTFLDLRLINNLDPKQHFTQQKQMTVVSKGQSFTLNDITTAEFESYDSLRQVFRLFSTLNRDTRLNEFSFILDWPELDTAAKRKLYSQYACHELNFFLCRKDPEFFESVIRPYLANKLHKTFMDHFLLGDELASYLRPGNLAV